MSTALDKTKSLRREDVPITLIDPTHDNPNEMTQAEFNLLCQNIEETGLTDALLVRALPNGRYRLIGGNHRFEALKLYDFETAPCTIIDDPEFSDDLEKFQVVRMNMIRGRLSPQKFMKLYETLSTKYAEEVMASMFGFAEEEEFRKIVGQVAKTLPKDMQSEFKKAASEIKTIDGLSKLLNGLFSKYGDTLPYGYMMFDFGGKESVWLRMSSETRKAVEKIGGRLKIEKRTMDAVLGGLVQMLANGQLEPQLVQLIAKSQPVVLSEEFLNGAALPTEENLGAA